jgi:hypothetical protein
MPDSWGSQLAPEGSLKVMTIFFLLNGLGIVFLLYVLANFWKEGHQPKNNAWKSAVEYERRDWPNVVVVTHPISHSAQGGLSVIPFRIQESHSGKPARRTTSNGASEEPVRRFSTR